MCVCVCVCVCVMMRDIYSRFLHRKRERAVHIVDRGREGDQLVVSGWSVERV